MFPYKNVLAAVDYSEITDEILKKLESICENSDTNVTLFHVVERDMPTLIGASQNAAISYSREWSSEELKLKEEAETRLEERSKEYNLGKV